MGSREGYVLLQQHSQDLIVVPVGCQDDWSNVHGGGVLWVLNALHQFLKRNKDIEVHPLHVIRKEQNSIG